MNASKRARVGSVISMAAALMAVAVAVVAWYPPAEARLGRHPVTTTVGALVAITPATTPTSNPPSQPDQRIYSPAGDRQPLRAALAEARARWTATKPAHGYTWRETPILGLRQDIVEVEVDGGGLVTGGHVTSEDGTVEAFAAAHSWTVEGVFDIIQHAVDLNPDLIVVRFDTDFGFPVSYYVDPSLKGADEEWGDRFSGFAARRRDA